MTSNVTSPPPRPDCGFDETTVSLVIPSLYFLLFVPAILLNGVAAWISVRVKSKSSFMVYLKNLVAANLLMSLTIPLKAAGDLRGAPLGLVAFTCRFSNVLFYFSMYISIILMGLISLDRFFKIVRPCGRLLGQNLFLSKVLSTSFWILLLSVTVLPTMLLTNQYPSNKTGVACMLMKSPAGRKFHKTVIIINSIIFWVVCILIGFCYTCITVRVVRSYRNSGSNNDKGDRKIKARVFLILVVFLACYVPYHVIRLPYTQHQVANKGTCTEASLKIAKEFSLWLSATNVCLEPLIYFFLCKAFRKKLYEIKSSAYSDNTSVLGESRSNAHSSC